MLTFLLPHFPLRGGFTVRAVALRFGSQGISGKRVRADRVALLICSTFCRLTDIVF